MNRPNTLVFVRRNGLIVAGKHVTPARLQFSEKLIHHLELVDGPKFVEHCRHFFSKQSLKHRRVLMVLDQDVTFEKISQAGGQDDETALQQFVAAMPFDAGKRASFSVAVDDTTRIYGANYELFYAIAQALEAADAKVMAITPLTLYGLEPGQQLKDVVSKLLKDGVVRKQANFARVQPA